MTTTTAITAPSFKPTVEAIKTFKGRISCYRASVFGFEAHGRTKELALDNLHTKMCWILPPNGKQSVALIHSGDWTAIVWYDVEDGWVYSVRHREDPRDLYGNTAAAGRNSREETMEFARLQLAIQAYVPDIVNRTKVKHPGVPLTQEHSQEFTQRAISANRYQYAIQIKGMSPDDAHSYALKNPQRSDLWLSDENQ